MAKTPPANADELVALIEHPTPEEAALVREAFEFARKAHEGHERNSGEPYFNHVYATAYSLAELGMGPRTIVAGLLHDSIEDVGVTREDIEAKFGAEVLFLVDGVTKLGTLKYRGAQRHVESLRRLFVATSQDIRVLMIKLMDRLHNMQTLEHVRPEKQERIASETLEIYAPLADRLGMGRLKHELEDLAFKYVNPEAYEEMSKIMRENTQTRVPQLAKVAATLKRELTAQGVRSFRTEHRVKGLYSLYCKLKRKDNDLDRIHDMLAIRVIVPTIGDCYRVLGVVHSLWRPLPGKIKDYIAFEKPNGYRSIHTTVVTQEAGPIEIQVRTEEMHREAQFGIASHLTYKEALGRFDRGMQKRNKLWYHQLIPSLLRTRQAIAEMPNRRPPSWVQDLAKAHEADEEDQGSSHAHYLSQLKSDFFSHRVFVFTPKGDVVDLPIDSSPLDFAYAIHSDIGDHTASARVNGKIAALDTMLKNGDIVEIETKTSSKPSKKWLEYAKTTLARRHIHQALAKEQKALSSQRQK